MERKQQLAFLLSMLALLVILLAQNFSMRGNLDRLPYGEFKALVKAEKVKNVVLGEQVLWGTLVGEEVEGLVSKQTAERLRQLGPGEHPFSTIRVNDPTLVQDLEAAKIPFTGVVESKWFATLLSWILPALIFVAIWQFFMRRMGGGAGIMAIGKSRARIYMEKGTGVTFDDVAGIDEAKEELMQVVEFLKAIPLYTSCRMTALS